MEKFHKKHSEYYKPSTKIYHTESNNLQFTTLNSTNINSFKKHHKHHKKNTYFESESNLNNYLNFHHKLDNSTFARKKFNRGSIKSINHLNNGKRRTITSNWKYNKELENIGKINSSTKSFTPILGLRYLESHDNHNKRENISNENSNYQKQQKKVKVNMVSLKFKIANDYDEAHSNIFLKEKDECLKQIKLSDKIEDYEFELSPISPTHQQKKTKMSKNFKSFGCVNNSSDSGEFLSHLLMEVQ